MKTRLPAVALTLAALLALGGCATMPVSAPPAAPPAAKPAVKPTAPTPAPQPQAAAIDTTKPSREAQDVLANIPEPLSAAERVPAPAVSDTSVGFAADTLRATVSDSARALIPVPTPTPVLGERPTPTVEATPDTGAAATSPPPGLAGPPPGLAMPDTCWRVQIAAPAEKARAERYLEASKSQLMVPMVIEHEKGLYKVRTRDCMDHAAAGALRQRAADAGFSGAFRFQWKKP